MNKFTPTGGDEALQVAEYLNQKRKDAGLTVEDLVITTGIPKRTLDRKLGPNPGTLTLRDLILISNALNIPVADAFEAAA